MRQPPNEAASAVSLHMSLNREQTRNFYDRFGKKQDGQGFYEEPAFDALVANAQFGEANRVFEFGCGTGKFAERLLSRELPQSATYTGCDISPVMVNLATERTAPYGSRARVIRLGEDLIFPIPANSVDRVVSTYVLDLLSASDIAEFLSESRRVLAPQGRLCLTALTAGTTLLSRCVTSIWRYTYRLNPALVGGCHPLSLGAVLRPNLWDISFQNVVVAWGIPSEIVVATPRNSTRQGNEPDA